MNTRQPIPCPHGVLGKTNCPDCKREYNRMASQRWRDRQRALHGPKPRPLKTCQHGTVGSSRCPQCRRDASNRVHARNRAEAIARGEVIKTTMGPAPKVCPHGVVGLSNCATCVNDKANARREAHRAEKRAAGWEPWAVTRQPCHHGFARKSDCITCRRDTAILVKTRRRLQPGARFDETVTLSAVIERDKGLCGHCGRKVYTGRDRANRERLDSATIDHLFPISRGGDHVWKNVVLSCRACNTEKLDDVCKACFRRPIRAMGEDLCEGCHAKGRKPRVFYAVCAHCGKVEVAGGSWCLSCKAKGPGLWAATGLTRTDAHALSRSLGFDPKHPGKPEPVTTE